MTQTVTETQVREAAYYLWLEDGRPEGRDEEHWLRAVDALNQPQPKAKPKPKRKAAAKTAVKAAPKAKTTKKARAPKAAKTAK